MWYEDNISLKKNEPIFAEDNIGNGNVETWVLLPFVPLGPDGSKYDVTGFRWFNIETGKYDTVGRHKTVSVAIKAYGRYKIYNGKIKAEMK